MMHDEAQKQALKLNLDIPPGQLKQTGWKQYTRNPKFLAGAGVGVLLLVGLGISLFSSSPESEVYEASPEAQLDKGAIVAGAQDSHTNTVFQSTQQLEEFEQQLLSQEAQRFLLEAQKQTTEADKPCFAQSVYCALDQFQADAVSRIEQARSDRNWLAMLSALDRVEAIELARGATTPTEPEVNLSQLAIDNLVQSHQRYRGAQAESKAWEVQQQ
ncbi:MAG: hypothetical protein F6J95_007665 [Leptolyngbya sp. SIO1E4]|nr:hypothetical protein [Leptolyngbya sp. SIO1E4]